MVDLEEGSTPSEPHDFRKDDRKHNVGREGRTPRNFTKTIEDNPIVSIIAVFLVTTLSGLIKDQVKQNNIQPGASSVQIETVLVKVEAMGKQLTDLSGDVRTIKESNLGERVRKVEDFIVKQTTLADEQAKELAERRHNWEDWRKSIDAFIVEQRSRNK